MFGPADCFLFFSGCLFRNVFQEQNYSNFHSGQSLAYDHFDYPCSVIADFGGVIADPCVAVTIPEAISGCAIANVAMPIVDWLTKHRKTLWNIMKHLNTPAWNFLSRIKHTSSTYFCRERPISHCMANIWICPHCQEFQRRFKQIITNAI